MRGTNARSASIISMLVFAAISLSPRSARAQSKQEIRVYAGGELGGTSGFIDIGVTVGVAYAPVRYVSFGIVGAYALFAGNGCDVLVSGDADDECPNFHAYRVTSEVELDPFEREVVQPFFVAIGGIFGEHDTASDADPKVVPTFGGGGGFHFFPVRFLSVDVAVRVLYADSADNQIGKVWGIFSLGATPRISF